jgi:hypothetical protein
MSVLSIPPFRLYALYRKTKLAALRPAPTQERELLRLMRRAHDTRFGRDHDFARVRDVADFQERVPLRRYEDFWTEYWREPFPRLVDLTWPGTIPYFAVTSGTTTGATKYIPLSWEMNTALRWAGADLMVQHVIARPESSVFAGKSFMLGGSTDLVEEAPGIYSGDISGIIAGEVPWWAQGTYFPPRDLALIADWEEKIARLAPLSLEQDIRSISGTPSWLLIFFDKLATLRPELPARLASWYPELELLVHGGVNFAPYRARFEALLEGSHAELREVYPASEGFIALADRGYGEGLRLIVDNGLFFEFVPVEELDRAQPTRHWLASVELGINYALVVSSCAGLWSYIIGDTVKFVDRDPPRILITGRISYSLSAFGEHLIDQEIEESVAAAAGGIRAAVSDFSVGALFPDQEGELGGHLFVVEFAKAVSEEARVDAFAETLDVNLSKLNDDYRSHRSGDFGLRPPRVMAVPPGTFAAWMKSRGQLGGQHKVPRVINDPDLFRDLRQFAAR